MRDVDIRLVLRDHLDRRYKTDAGTMIVEELGLCRGTVRVDLAVVNGSLKGFEIKSARDTLRRLSAQAATYSRIFDTMTIIVAERHLQGAEALIPRWWGIQVVTTNDSSTALTIEQVRRERTNPQVDPKSLVQLLWRPEVLELLNQRNLTKFLKSKPRQVLWDVLAQTVPLLELQQMVRTCLRSRSHWRVDAPRRQGGETSQPSSTLSDFPYQHVLPRSRRYTDRPN